MQHRSPLIPLFILILLSAACGDSNETAAETTLTTSTVAATTTTTPSTTTQAATTTTTAAPETTTAPTTTVTTTTAAAECPDFPAIGMTMTGAGEDLEPGSYKVAWVLPKFTFTLADPTTAWLSEGFDVFGWRPVPAPSWQHPKELYEALQFTEFSHLFSYDGEDEIEIPEDPAAWLMEHPHLEAGDPTPVTISGYEGVQVDVVVLDSHPGVGDWLRFSGYDNSPGQKWLPKGAGVRIIFVEVADSPLWLILIATEDGFADAAAWSDTVIAGIEFC